MLYFKLMLQIVGYLLSVSREEFALFFPRRFGSCMLGRRSVCHVTHAFWSQDRFAACPRRMTVDHESSRWNCSMAIKDGVGKVEGWRERTVKVRQRLLLLLRGRSWSRTLSMTKYDYDTTDGLWRKGLRTRGHVHRS